MQLDPDPLTLAGESPHMNWLLSLQHKVIGKNVGQPDFAVPDRAQQGQQQGAKKVFQDISPKNNKPKLGQAQAAGLQFRVRWNPFQFHSSP